MAEGDDRLGMTEEQRGVFQAYTHGYGEQDANGVDLAALRENLKLTPTERLEKLIAAQSFLEECTRADARRNHRNRAVP